MSTGAERLVQMINQIARFFDTQPGDAAAQTLHHIKSYWAPTMLREFVEFMHDGTAELSPTARATALSLEAVLGAPTPADIHAQDAARSDH